MIGALIIVFREVLEAALVVGVVAAAVKGLPHRGRHVLTGIAIGIGGAILVAAGLGVISHFAAGHGQEIFQAAVLIAAGLMLAWHNIYMAKHGRELTRKLKTLGSEVVAGSASITMLIGVTAIAVMREGSEVALFLYALVAGGTSQASLLGGSLLGLAGGVVVGFVLFAGLSRIPIKRLFQVSGVIILFIAAGMLAHGVQYLVQIGYLPALIPHVWDSSFLISGRSYVGISLGALAGYTPSPSLMQVLVWMASFIAIAGLMFTKSGRLDRKRNRTKAAALQTEQGGS
ncbi:MAG: FTR1 family protein [Gammaproteobacteria bacterium]|nr:FTR1 family protein [Gammaproteobacteria bacterium]